jgi:hypothetical protein
MQAKKIDPIIKREKPRQIPLFGRISTRGRERLIYFKVYGEIVPTGSVAKNNVDNIRKRIWQNYQTVLFKLSGAWALPSTCYWALVQHVLCIREAKIVREKKTDEIIARKQVKGARYRTCKLYHKTIVQQPAVGTFEPDG